MDWATLLNTFAVVFVAELGDKTQLTAMTLATRHPARKVFLGVALAFTVLNLLAVGVGEALFRVVSPLWIQLAAGALFAVFGIKAIRDGGGDEEGEEEERSTHSVVIGSFLAIFLAELGDKTQLATAGLAARTGDGVAVFAGSTLALWSTSLLGIVFGKKLLQRLPPAWVHRTAGALFLAFSAFSLRAAYLIWTGAAGA
jgi:putative Ca2+/H+ antiporter (TMEM165/GDT1 family)